MSFNFHKASSYTITDGEKYFLDANIWLKILNPQNKIKYKDKNYLELFERIITSSKVKIIVSSLVLSEIINRLMRDVYYQKHLAKIKKTNSSFVPPSNYYKEIFRPSNDYKTGYALICDEIKNYHSNIIQINDSFGDSIRFKHVLNNPPTSLDFNDYYYYNLCKKFNYILVTDDKDFWVEGINVITMSQTLLDKSIANIIQAKYN